MDLAVIGMSCRLPGANNLHEYWQLLIEGRSAWQEMPPERLNRELYHSPVRGTLGKTYSTIAGVVPDLPPEPGLEDFNPASRHLLAVIQDAFKSADLDARRLFTRRVGVYVGHASSGPLAGYVAFSTHIEETVQRLRAEPEFAGLPEDKQLSIERAIVDEVRERYPHRQPGGAPFTAPPDGAALAARLFGWDGPVMAIDAACASSLQALAIARDALLQGHCDLAVVGGASVNSVFNMVLFSQAQALSDSGSFPFDARANGFVSSDGYCAIVVAPLERAIAGGRRIFGVVRGIGCASDGRGHSLWAPDKDGQKLAIDRAWGDRLDRSRLQYVEAHATSTALGDGIELCALAESLGPSIPARIRIPIASVKANVGHTKEAAGLASLIKVLLSMQHRLIPPANYFRAPAPDMDWSSLPV
jgi:acyl transferase domain-containing protein